MLNFVEPGKNVLFNCVKLEKQTQTLLKVTQQLIQEDLQLEKIRALGFIKQLLNLNRFKLIRKPSYNRYYILLILLDKVCVDVLRAAFDFFSMLSLGY